MIKYINRAKINFLKLEKTTTKFLLAKVSGYIYIYIYIYICMYMYIYSKNSSVLPNLRQLS